MRRGRMRFNRMRASDAQILHRILDEPRLKMGGLAEKPAGSYHLVHNESRLIRSQIHPDFIAYLVHNGLEGKSGQL